MKTKGVSGFLKNLISTYIVLISLIAGCLSVEDGKFIQNFTELFTSPVQLCNSHCELETVLLFYILIGGILFAATEAVILCVPMKEKLQSKIFIALTVLAATILIAANSTYIK